MPTKLLRQIKNTLPELRKSERLVADFVLKDPKSVITMKTAEASSAMGISECVMSVLQKIKAAQA